jgi:hypothetical protein
MKKTTAEKTAPFQYQKDCLKVIKKVSATKGRALIAIAQGYGRTIIIALALKELLKERRIRRALIVVPHKVLEEQFIRVFAGYSLKSIKLFSHAKKNLEPKLEHELKDASVVVSSLAMFRKEVFQLAPGFFDIAFFDECHDLSERDWKVADQLKSAIIGLTATYPLLINREVLSFFKLDKPTYSYGMSSVKLEDLADIFLGENYNSSELLDKGKWKFIRPRDIKDGRIAKAVAFASDKLIERSRRNILKVGDIVLQNVFNFGKMGIIENKDLPAIASKNLFVIRSTRINPNFLFNYLQSEAIAAAFRKQLEDHAHGVLIRHISLGDAREIPVPLPFSEEHLWKLADIKRSGNLQDLVKARNEIAHLRSAYKLYSKREE